MAATRWNGLLFGKSVTISSTTGGGSIALARHGVVVMIVRGIAAPTKSVAAHRLRGHTGRGITNHDSFAATREVLAMATEQG